MSDFLLSTAEVHRRLTIDSREYSVVVYDAGGGFVGLRVIGRDGRLAEFACEIHGELPQADAPEVTGLVAAVLAGYRAEPLPPLDWWAAHRAAAPNAGRPWAPHDLDLLVARFTAGASVKALTAELGRTAGGIRARLQQLGLTRPASPGGADPPEAAPVAPATPGAEGRLPLAG
ncbi:hypothetical protein KZZ52_59420 [Dactylosporangium sp. AC04546]|uniref:hypothetical protein n=1 Tax=Dactylosporangium sp. AC04546 TaxID=2862460 RepID=UPI001EDECA39|nr:hypothetical protein [Dactylosporangium sp. AC04546]WVK83751.1 hypothetical protein KZZ52_59420 [Dactylosporangium sp. AC04546]